MKLIIEDNKTVYRLSLDEAGTLLQDGKLTGILYLPNEISFEWLIQTSEQVGILGIDGSSLVVSRNFLAKELNGRPSKHGLECEKAGRKTSLQIDQKKRKSQIETLSCATGCGSRSGN